MEKVKTIHIEDTRIDYRENGFVSIYLPDPNSTVITFYGRNIIDIETNSFGLFDQQDSAEGFDRLAKEMEKQNDQN